MAKFVVREPERTANQINQTAGLAREVEELYKMMTDAIRNPEAAYQYSIRPNKIKELLPDPIVLQMNVIAHPDGTLDYSPAIRGLQKRKEDLELRLRVLALNSVTKLDNNGKPPKDLERTLDCLSYAIIDTEEDYKRLLSKMALPSGK